MRSEFKVGQEVLIGTRKFIIAEVIAERTIRLAVGELDLGNKDILKECINKHPQNYEFCIAKWFIIQKLITHSNYKSVRKADPIKQKEHIRKMIKLDKVDPSEVIDILHFALTDNFWKDNLLTLSALRTRSKNGLMKWENIRKSLLQARKRGKI